MRECTSLKWLWWYVTFKCPVSSAAFLSLWPTSEPLKCSLKVFQDTVTSSEPWLMSSRPS
jgi:hypothetical protein